MEQFKTLIAKGTYEGKQVEDEINNEAVLKNYIDWLQVNRSEIYKFADSKQIIKYNQNNNDYVQFEYKQNYEVATIDFYGDDILAARDNQSGEIYVVLKHLCQNLGIDFVNQFKKIKNDPHKWGHGDITITTSGGNKTAVCLPLTKLNGWLFSINPSKIPDEVVRNKVILTTNANLNNISICLTSNFFYSHHPIKQYC